MVTNEERREVAKRLRDIDDERWYNVRDELKAIDAAVDTAYGMSYASQALWELLADLIEPEPKRTCHKELMIWFFPTTGLTSEYEVEYFGCSECGEWLSDTDCYGLDDGPNYCENCGCEVDKSFVTDEYTGEVIYRDGAKVAE